MYRHHLLSRRLPILSQRLVSITILFALLSTFLLAGAASAAPTQAPLNIQGKAAFLMDATTGQVLYQLNADKPLPPASMSKMMTEYLVMKAVRSGKLKWNDTITVTENAALQVGSKIFLAEGDKHTVEQLYIAMAVGSANDATTQLAEVVGGSEENFVKMMNDTAKQMGLKDSRFINATGLDRVDLPVKYRPTSIDGETMMSARDSAMLAYHVLKEEPDFLKYSSMQKFKFRERDAKPIDNWDWMLGSNKNNPFLKKFAYEGVDGMKTGHTPNAGNCFTGTALRNGTRLIAVVMGVPGGTNDGMRFLETAKLFDYGFNTFEKKIIVEAKAAVKDKETLKVSKGASTNVAVVTAQDVSILVPKGSNVQITSTTLTGIADPLAAPIKQGDKVGTASFKFKDPATGEDKTVTVDMVANEDVSKAGWLKLFFRSIGALFSNLFHWIGGLF